MDFEKSKMAIRLAGLYVGLRKEEVELTKISTDNVGLSFHGCPEGEGKGLAPEFWAHYRPTCRAY